MGMQITYINRKGTTYYLCRGVTKTGKPRFFFAREPQGTPVVQLPEGYSVSENVNGIVSLGRARPAQILPEAVAAVEAELSRLPDARKYRVDMRKDRIVVYENSTPDIGEILAMMGLPIPPTRAALDELRADQERRATYSPVLRFILLDPSQRTFRTERMCYLGSIDDWINVFPQGPIKQLAQEVLPKLGRTNSSSCTNKRQQYDCSGSR